MGKCFPIYISNRVFNEKCDQTQSLTTNTGLFSACNKTYTGSPSSWHSLRVPRPRGDKLPFSCYLSFSAPPSLTIQLSIQELRLGRLVSTSPRGCPHGHLTIAEDRPGGSIGPPGSGSGSGYICGSVDNNTRNCSHLLTSHSIPVTCHPCKIHVTSRQ